MALWWRVRGEAAANLNAASAAVAWRELLPEGFHGIFNEGNSEALNPETLNPRPLNP